LQPRVLLDRRARDARLRPVGHRDPGVRVADAAGMDRRSDGIRTGSYRNHRFALLTQYLRVTDNSAAYIRTAARCGRRTSCSIRCSTCPTPPSEGPGTRTPDEHISPCHSPYAPPCTADYTPASGGRTARP